MSLVDQKTSSTKLSFKPRARIIRTIGDRLIRGPETAVVELVKNSHDADASYVTVRIEPSLIDRSGRIIVEDDGHGMTLEQIESRWMEPATTDKLERRRSPGKRLFLGSKGIGRFAAARLGHFLELRSTAQVPNHPETLQTTHIPHIDWDEFDRTRYLSDVEFDCNVVNSGEVLGTKLIVSELRDQWTESRLTDLHKEMRRLISPLEEAERADFKIYLDLSEFTEANSGFDGSQIVNGSTPSEFDTDPHRILPFPLLKSCDYEVQGEFDETGFFSGKMTVHRGGLEPETIELEVPLEEGQKNCGLVLIHFFIFDREADALKRSMSRAGTGDVSLKQARAFVDEIAGVAIYRDTFRIRPYGDNDYDWLTLDKRRVQNPSMRIGHDQVSGIVMVADEQASGLIERSSREGLEENESYRRLRGLISALLDMKIEPKRRVFRERAEIERNKSDALGRARRSAEFGWAKRFAQSLPDDQRSKAEKKIDEESRALSRHLKELENTQAKLQAQVTLGLILGEVLHEGRRPVGYIYDQSKRLFLWWPDINADTKESEENRKDIPRILRGMTTRSSQLRDLFNALKPLAGGKRGNPRYYSPNQVVIDTLFLFESRAQAAQVKTSHVDKTGGKDVLGYREDLATALTNIIENALFWLEHHKVNQPTISITVCDEDTHCSIAICDNGRGIPEEFRNSIFDVGFSLKPNGTGLGLSIAQESVSRSQGEISLLENSPGACFSIQIPYGD